MIWKLVKDKETSLTKKKQEKQSRENDDCGIIVKQEEHSFNLRV
jgi:hypothetical protein